jgi:NADH-quinone oxidoreductase subunit H
MNKIQKFLKITKAIFKTARASFIPVGKQMIAYFMRPIKYRVAPFVYEVVGALKQLIRENVTPILQDIYHNLKHIFIDLKNGLIFHFGMIFQGVLGVVVTLMTCFVQIFVLPMFYYKIYGSILYPYQKPTLTVLIPLFFVLLIFYFLYKIVSLVALIQFLIIAIPLLAAIAYFTLAERKILGAIQRRRGPNVIGAYGLLQPLADGFKLLVKETIIPSNSNKIIFVISPILTFTLSLMGWAVIPYDKYAVFSQINLGLLYLFAVSSLGVYGVIMSGWSSNSKYAFLGSLRSAAQMVSYEISIGFIILTVAICSGSFDLQEIVESQRDVWFVVLFSPLALIFFICSLAETNRHPFDLPEAEAELVSGYNVEYSAMGFALFSLGEYCHMLLMSALNVTLFFGGWLSPFCFLNFIPGAFWFGLKIAFFVILFIVIRAALPRYRYDQLMGLGWKVFFPISVSYLIITVCILECFNMMPY